MVRYRLDLEEVMLERQLPILQKERETGGLEAEFVGFTPDQVKSVKKHFEATGLPLENIETVVYKKNQKGEENVLGSFQPTERTVTLYKDLNKLPPIAQHGTIVHEQSHSVSPLNPENQRFYGSIESFERAREHAIAVSKQSLETRKFINGYHAFLAKQLEAGQIDTGRFVEETSAILMETRFNNAEHLKQVNEAQKNKAGANAVDIISGVDETLISLIPQVNSKEDLDEHIEQLKKKVLSQGKPVLSNQHLPLAA